MYRLALFEYFPSVFFRNLPLTRCALAGSFVPAPLYAAPQQEIRTAAPRERGTREKSAFDFRHVQPGRVRGGEWNAIRLRIR